MRTQIEIKQNTHNAHTIAFVYLFLILVFGCVSRLIENKKKLCLQSYCEKISLNGIEFNAMNLIECQLFLIAQFVWWCPTTKWIDNDR